MITKILIWDNLLYKYYNIATAYTTPLRVMGCLILTIFTIPIDILLLPLEVFALIIYALIEDDKEDN